MQKNFILSIVAVAMGAMAITSCSSKLGPLSADNFKVTPNPLELQANQVPVTIYGAFPEKYMNKKAVVTVVPELRYGSQVQRGQGATFQGEKVLGNDQTVSYILGGHYNMRDAFDYTDDMHRSELYLTFDARVGKKQVSIPAVKVADGIIATAGLYRQALLQGGGIIAPDTFQQVRKAKQEASIKFLINQAQLRKSELKNNSVQEFVKLLGKINADAEKYNLQDVEVLAYASPDGGEQYNTELAGKRQKESVKYVDSQLKANKVNAPITGNYTAQDWEGFQQLVAASDIQDKELILRVLSMYKDPQEREQQIKNLSQGFRDLADQILPQLRRSRMIINYESIGRSDEQIEAQYNTTTGVLSADEILYYATLVSNIDKKEEIYTKCAQIYPSDYRAYNNVAAVKLAKGDMESARFYLQRALAADPQAGEPQSNYALIALKNGNVSEAESFLSKAGRSAGLNEVQGAVNLVKGNYKQAAENYNGVYNNMAALSQILAEDYASARATFNQIGKQGDGLTDYLHAILGARQENKYAATSYLQDAFSKNPSLKAYYDDDLEFVNVKE